MHTNVLVLISINLVIHIFNAHRVLDDIVVVWHVCLVDRCQEGAISSRMSSRERKVLDLLANIIESDTKTLTELSQFVLFFCQLMRRELPIYEGILLFSRRLISLLIRSLSSSKNEEKKQRIQCNGWIVNGFYRLIDEFIDQRVVEALVLIESWRRTRENKGSATTGGEEILNVARELSIGKRTGAQEKQRNRGINRLGNERRKRRDVH